MLQQTIGDRYQVTGRLGRGGMATVYRAQDQRLLRDVAVKVLPTEQQREDSGFYFHREARAIAAMRHPNIVQIFDYSGPDEQPSYIVMELVEGSNLDQLLIDQHPLPEAAVLAVAHGIASALTHAHEGGVIHRDLKPANVMVNPTGRVVLTDFGIAKAYRDAKRLGHTLADRATRLFGTPDFMAPEQILERPVGPHTDVFALGAMIYCLSMCHSPFAHDDTVETLRKVVDADFVELRRMRRDVSPELSTLVGDCLQVSETARPTAEDVANRCEALLVAEGIANPQRALRRFLAGEVIGKSTERPAADTVIQRQPTTSPNAHTTAEVVASEAATQVTGEHASLSTRSVVQETTLPDDGPDARGDTAIWSEPAADQTEMYSPGDASATQPHISMTSEQSSRRELPTARVGRGEGTRRAPPPAPRPRPARHGMSSWWVLLAAGLGVAILGAIIWKTSRPTIEYSEVTPVIVAEPAAVSKPVLVPAPTPTAAAAAATTAEGASPAAELTEADSIVESTAGASEDNAGATGRKPRGKRKTRRRAEDASEPAVVAGEGTIDVRVKPWGTVFLDDRRLGNTPMIRRIQTSSGTHVLKVLHPSLGERSQTVRVKPQQAVGVTFDLRE